MKLLARAMTAVLVISFCGPAMAADTVEPVAATAGGCGDPFQRTELFFGSARPDGSAVTEEEFAAFVEAEVTPRFPDGLTLLVGRGQFRNGNVIVRERSFVLILLYPLEEFQESSRRINAIRERYKDEFDQESVLRVDDPFAVRVSF